MFGRGKPVWLKETDGEDNGSGILGGAGGPVVLGRRYRDTITGFEGIAVNRTTHLYGCVQVGLEGPGEGGQDVKGWAFDEQRLVDAETAKPVETNAKTGGPTTSFR